jgi:hypothetical protein
MAASRRLVVVAAFFLVAVNQLMRLHAPIRQIKKIKATCPSACAPVQVKVDSLSNERYFSQVSLVRPISWERRC